MARHVFQKEYRTPVVHQGYMETHSCVVDIRPNGEIWVWSNNKTPYRMQQELGSLLGVPFHQIRVITPNIGGDFGSWDKDPNDETQGTQMAFEPEDALGDPAGYSVRLDFVRLYLRSVECAPL